MYRRLAVLFDNLGPYHIARLKAAALSFDLLAIELRRESAEYAWRSTQNVPFQRIALSDAVENDKKLIYQRLSQQLDGFQPAAIAVPGWSSGFAISAIRWAHKAQVPIVVMSDSQEIDFERYPWKEQVKKRILRGCGAALVGGQSHCAYIQSLGPTDQQVFVGYDVVDNTYFEEQAKVVRSMSRFYQERLNLPAQYFLCSARFISKKNLPSLLNSYRRYLDDFTLRSSGNPAWNLVILGDGQQRRELEELIRELGLVDQVYLPGFRQIDEIPAFYALANAFVLPSTTEQWGLVVNEAMACGLPVLVSERCGCSQDLVANGINGFTFDPYNVDELSGLMARIAGPDCDRAAMGQASAEIIARWSPDTFAAGLEAAVNAALECNRCPAGWLDRLMLRALSFR